MATAASATRGNSAKDATSGAKQLTVLGAAGKSSGTIELPAQLFDVEVNIPLIHQVVVAQQAAARAGTHSTKSRGEVSGGGVKPYRQKGTGRARQGSIRAPQFAGGGIVHGPTPRDYSQRTPKKMKAAALRSALSDRARHGLLFALEALVDSDVPSTKAAQNAVTQAVGAALSPGSHALVVLTRDDDVAVLSSRNLPDAHVLYVDQLNTYDVMVSGVVLFTKAALEQFIAASKAGTAADKSASTPGAKQEAVA